MKNLFEGGGGKELLILIIFFELRCLIYSSNYYSEGKGTNKKEMYIF